MEASRRLRRRLRWNSHFCHILSIKVVAQFKDGTRSPPLNRTGIETYVTVFNLPQLDFRRCSLHFLDEETNTQAD